MDSAPPAAIAVPTDQAPEALLEPQDRLRQCVLLEWLVEQLEELALTVAPDRADRHARQLCRRGRAIAHFVRLWCHDRAWGSALQLAASERFAWPMPDTQLDACELMQEIVFWETQQHGGMENQAA